MKKGSHHTEESRRKLSLALTGKKLSPETIQKIVKANTGKKRALEVCRGISERQRGKKRSPSIMLPSHLAAAEYWRGRNHSPETILKMSEARKGIKYSSETIQKMSDAAKNRTGEHQRRISESLRGRSLSCEHRQKISENQKGRKRSIETRTRMSTAQKGKRHWNWQGGDSKRNRSSVVYNEWRRKVFERDNYTCVECGVRGGSLHAHHIVPWVVDCKQRYEVANGSTLCAACHIEVHKKMGRRKIA